MDIKTISIIVGALLAVSETLSLVPQVRANGIVQMLWNVLKIATGAKEKED